MGRQRTPAVPPPSLANHALGSVPSAPREVQRSAVLSCKRRFHRAGPPPACLMNAYLTFVFTTRSIHVLLTLIP